MPRLLLVDDNPSIHKIAETLLAGSDVEMTCCASGAEALALIQQGERFEVALVDISMLGMDGWELLANLRQLEATARMPVAMMAGVLDVVDPERLRLAPIQGFLKKPVELRDLGDRVKRLLETQVQLPEPEFAELEITEPEFMDAEIAEEPAAPAASSLATVEFLITPPSLATAEFLITPPSEPMEAPAPTPDDLLILGPEDLYAGEPTVKTTEVPEAETFDGTLDLEELDLEGLRGLTLAPEEAAKEAVDDFTFMEDLIEPAPSLESAPLAEEPPDFAPGDAYPDGAQSVAAAIEQDADELSDLFLGMDAPPAAAAIQPLDGDAGDLDWSEGSDSILEELGAEPEFTIPVEPEVALAAEPEFTYAAEPEATLPAEPEFTFAAEPEATIPAPLDLDDADTETLAGVTASFLEFVSGPGDQSSFSPAPPVFEDEQPAGLSADAPAGTGSSAAGDLLSALLSDPVLMERLTKAVVSRMGDQALREIAWEIMPELSDRLHRN